MMTSYAIIMTLLYLIRICKYNSIPYEYIFTLFADRRQMFRR